MFAFTNFFPEEFIKTFSQGVLRMMKTNSNSLQMSIEINKRYMILTCYELRVQEASKYFSLPSDSHRGLHQQKGLISFLPKYFQL